MDLPAPRSRGPEYAAPRRVVTAPMTLQSSRRRDTTTTTPDSLVETLYNHPDVKIVAFNATGKAALRDAGSASATDDGEEPGTLMPSSRLERTIAFGPFRIYRAPGSVAFLSCGSALKPILPKSQCWCIDEINSKFVLQIRRPNYWRIELPVSSFEDQQRALVFRSVLDGVLQFEKTECPFKRSFIVELPEPPSTPVKKKPWTPVKRLIPEIVPEGSSTVTGQSAEPDARIEAGDGPAEAALQIESVGHAESQTQVKTKTKVDSDIQIESTPYLEPEVIAEQKVSTPVGQETTPSTDEPLDVCTRNSSQPGLQAILHVSEDAFESQHTSNQRIIHEQGLSEEVLSSPGDPKTTIYKGLEAVGNGDSLLSSDAVVPTEAARIEKLVASSDYPTAVIYGGMDEALPTTAPSDSPSWKLRHDTAVSETLGQDFPVVDLKSELRAPVNIESNIHEGAGSQKGMMKARLRRTAGFKYAPVRSVTSPPQLTLVTSPPSKTAQRGTSLHSSETPGNVSPTGSQDSFHSVQSWHSPITPLPPSPPMSLPKSPATFPFPHENITMPRREALERHTSDLTITPGTGRTWEVVSNAGSDGSEDSVITAPDASTTSAAGPTRGEPGEYDTAAISTGIEDQRLGLKHRPSDSISMRRRALSPLPPAANVFSPTSTSERPPYYLSRLESMRKIPMAIIAKTCEMLLGPPSHLIALMLKVAARISAGEWRGRVYGYDDKGDQIPVQWDYSEGDFSDWSDDDSHLGHGLGHGSMCHPGGNKSVPVANELAEGESWDVD